MAPQASTSTAHDKAPRPTSMAHVLNQLEQMFPHADPRFLATTIKHLRHTKDEESDEQLIQRVQHKLIDVSFQEYPRCVKTRVPTGRKPPHHSTVGRGHISEHHSVKKRWQAAKGKRKHELDDDAHYEVDETLMKNQAIIRLHAMFSTTPISELRNAVLEQSHSYLFLAAEELLRQAMRRRTERPSTNPFSLLDWLGFTSNDQSSASNLASAPVLTRDDLLRSPAHTSALIDHLEKLYPSVPSSVVRSIVASGGSYESIREQVAQWRQRQSKLRIFLRDLFVPVPSASTSPGSLTAATISVPELLAELDEFSRPRLVAQAKEDEELARRLNAEWTPETGHFECGCCYADDVTFEEIVPCSSGEHFVCRSCLIRQIEEITHGASVATAEVKCLSTDGCGQIIRRRELVRALPDGLMKAWERRIAQSEIEIYDANRGVELVRCPFCPYVEQKDDEAIFDRALPLFAKAPPGSKGVADLVQDLVITIANLLILLFLYSFAIFAMLVNPAPFDPFYQPDLIRPTPDHVPPPCFFPLIEPHRIVPVAHRYLLDLAQSQALRASRSSTLFRCRNTPTSQPLPAFGEGIEATHSRFELVQTVWPLLDKGDTSKEGSPYCGRVSCRLCGKGVHCEGLHSCFEDQKEGLRLAIEKAMSEAVKRVCAKCGVAFTKDSGCNKMSCTRCGFVSCYVCRQAIGDESYNHFCQHFRPPVDLAISVQNAPSGTPETTRKPPLERPNELEKHGTAITLRIKDLLRR